MSPPDDTNQQKRPNCAFPDDCDWPYCKAVCPEGEIDEDEE